MRRRLGPQAQVFGYAVGLDLTRRDLQSAAKAKGLPWDTGKAFDHSAPISEIVRVDAVGALAPRTLSLEVNGALRQRSTLDQLTWDVPAVLASLSKYFELQPGDLVFMGTPAGVAALQPGDRFDARLDDVLHLHGVIAPPRAAR
jgi:2-keto-4-pentenoate hydratase/2-oxohepta-3-ene-1,7-dioic acid hydratase in catechol pathway